MTEGDIKATFPYSFSVSQSPNEDGRRNGGMLIVIDLARPEESKEVVDFLMTHWCGRPPISQLCQHDHLTKDYQWSAWIQRRVDASMSRSGPVCSLLARSMIDGRLVAVCLNRLEHDPPEWKSRLSENLMDALELQLNGEVDLFAQLKTDKILHVTLATRWADEKSRMAEVVATKLCQLSMEVAIAEGSIGAIKTEAVSFNLSRWMTELGFTTFNWFHMPALQHPDGSYPLAEIQMGVHRTARLLARNL